MGIVKEMEEDIQLKKSQRDVLESKDEGVHKKHDADLLKGLESSLPQTGLTNEQQNYAISHEIKDIMQDLAGDPSLDIENTNRSQLKKKGLSTKTIDEIMKLKHINEEVNTGQPVDIKHLRNEIDDVLNE